MALSKAKKAGVLGQFQDNLAKSKSVIFLDIKGLKVKEMEELRRECNKEGAECMVAKKTLMGLALKKAGIDELNPRELEGEVAAVFSYEDEVAPAKALAKFGKTHEAMQMKAGLLMGSPAGSRNIDAVGVARFAQLPSRQELFAKAVGSLASPLRGLVTVMHGVPRSFVQVLRAMSERA